MDQPRLSSAAIHILLTLSKGDQHGYSIMKAVEQLSNGNLHLGPATLYTTLKRLVDADFIVESDNRPDPELDDQRRRYYHLTSAGKHTLEEEMSHLELLLSQFKGRLV